MSRTTQPKLNYGLCSLFAVLILFGFSAGQALAACTSATGPYSINTTSTNCYLWNSGDVTVGSSGSITPSDTTKNTFATTGTVGTLTNNGSIYNNIILGGLGFKDIISFANDATGLVNNGLIQTSTSNILPIALFGARLTTFNNSVNGQIISASTGLSWWELAIYSSNSTITNFTNSGQIANSLGGVISLDTASYISSFNNTGTISGGNGSDAVGVQNGAYITTLNNSGTITSSGTGNFGSALAAGSDGYISTIINSGTISNTRTTGGGSWWSTTDGGSAIYNSGHILSLTNTGSIYTTASGAFGIYNNVDTSIDANVGQIDVLNNAQGGNSATSARTALTYYGKMPTNYNIIINSPTYYGQLAVSNTAATANGSVAFGIDSSSTLAFGRYVNVFSGTDISARFNGNTNGIFSGTGGPIGWYLSVQLGSTTLMDLIIGCSNGAVTLTSSQSCVNTDGSQSRGVISPTSLTNAGTITGSGGGYSLGVYNNLTGGSAPSYTNSGTISGSNTSSNVVSGIYNAGAITAITNSGTISATDTGSSIQNSNYTAGIRAEGTIGTITNNSGGMISGTSNKSVGVGIYANANITTITNNSGATISGTGTNNRGVGIYNVLGRTIGTITNAGTISSTGVTDPAGIYNAGTITALSNTGTISSISNAGTITTLNNAQLSLAYSGALATNYSIIINSPTSFGTLAVTSGTGSTAFSINSSSSVTADGTYLSVFSGSSLNITNLTGTYSGRSWTLGLHSGSTTLWDLVFGSSIGNIISPTSNLSNLGTSFTSIFEGGTLVVDSTSVSTTSNFTIKKNSSGAIDQGGNKTSTFSGVFADDAGGGTASKLTITNSGVGSGATNGVVTLSGVNTYTGGTKVEAGATLAITNKDAIGTGTLELVGSSTVSANFKTTSSMTISNAITVQGDPTFTAAPGTTLTISSPITDGDGAGDVVIGGTGGGGTVVLTAVNTYTGNTTIEASNTLALSGIGSIALSGTDATIGTGVINNGTFNIAGVTANTVSLGKNYTQSSSGSLAMNWYQKLTMPGTASLAGTLSLFNTNNSSYVLGRYTLITSTGALSGTFGTLNTTNLSSGYSYSLSYDANDAYLTIAPSKDYTQQSLVNTAANLQGTFALQNSILNSSLGYDCNLFGPNGVCISTGGRNTAVQAEGINNTSALLIAAYKVLPKVRIGAYADQNLSTQGPATVKLGNSTPLLGMFAAWNEHDDGTGLEVKASASYGQKRATVTRSVVVTSEPGSGSSNLTTQGAQFVTKYGFALTPKTIMTPYLGVRYSQSNMAGYTESTSTSVTSPLTYQALNTNATTLLAGASVTHALDPKTTVFASAGIESDTNTSNGSYSATSSNIAGLTPINFNPTAVKNRPTATVGAYYDVEKNQRLGIAGGYSQTPFKAVSTTSVMATYTVGL